VCYSSHKVFKSHVKSFQADFLYSSSTANLPWLSPTENWLVSSLNRTNSVTYIAKEWTRITGNTYHVITHRCVTSPRIRKTASCIVACWTVFTELLPGNALIKSVAICMITVFSENYLAHMLKLISSVKVFINWREFIKMVSIKFTSFSNTLRCTPYRIMTFFKLLLVQ
jgi:hypothetical protein